MRSIHFNFQTNGAKRDLLSVKFVMLRRYALMRRRQQITKYVRVASSENYFYIFIKYYVMLL